MATGFIDKDAVLAAANLLRSMGATQVFVFGRLLRAGCGQAPMSTWPPRDCRHRSTFQPSARHRTSSDDQSISSIWMSRHPWLVISSEAGNLFVSSDLANKLRLGLAELATVREQFASLVSLPATSEGVIERAAASAMLHSFYTEIEKILKLIAREWDDQMPASEAWHRELLKQMSTATAKRPAVLSQLWSKRWASSWRFGTSSAEPRLC